MMIHRGAHLTRIRSLLGQFPVVGLVGARQVGKTTLARMLAEEGTGPSTHFDLEYPEHRARLAEPVQALSGLEGLVVIDEVQHHPDLFPILRVLADRPERSTRFLILGSADPGLLRQSSESLEGRIAYHELGGFDLTEVGEARLDDLWIRGGFPRSLLAESDDASRTWRRHFLRTYLERDIANFGLRLPAETLRRFLTMVAHFHGNVLNRAELARSIDASERTVGRYLDVICSTYLARLLRPWHANTSKRQLKSPKVYLRDSGVLHTLLGVGSRHELLGHPKLGGSFEGFAIGEALRRLGAEPEECYFWALHSGHELDLLVVRGGRRLGFEVKFSDRPRVTRSMHAARETLELDEIVVIYPGERSFALGDGIRALALRQIDEDLEALP